MSIFDRIHRKSVTVDGTPHGWFDLGGPSGEGGFSSYNSQVERGYCENPYISRCTDLIADTVSSLEPIVYDLEGNEVQEQSLKQLFLRPNPLESWQGLVFDEISDFVLNGNLFAIPICTVRGVEKIWGIPPNLVSQEETTELVQPVRRWQVSDGSGAILVDPSNMIHARKKKALNSVLGISPLLPAGRSITQQTEARKWNLSLMRNGAKPTVIIMDPNTMTQQQFNDFVSRVGAKHAGVNNAGKVMVLDGGKTATSAGFNARDMDYSAGVTTSGREIAIAMGVPPELVGDSANKTYANAQEANKEFAVHTVLPTANRFYSAVSMRVCPHYEGIGRIGFDVSSIDGMRGDESTMITALETCSFLTVNEKRARLGFEPVDGGDVILAPMGSVPLEEVTTPIGDKL